MLSRLPTLAQTFAAGGASGNMSAGIRFTASASFTAGPDGGLLTPGEIEAGARRSAFTTIDAAPLLRDLVELYEAVAEDHGQALTADIPEEVPLFGDRDMLQQAVANLLDNALKFSPEAGTISLEAGEDGTGLFISVADQGPGIPEADRGRATERFFRGEPAHTGAVRT